MKVILAMPQQDKQTGLFIKNALLKENCEVIVVDTRQNYTGFDIVVNTIKFQPQVVFFGKEAHLISEISYLKNSFPNIILVCWNFDKRHSIYDWPKDMLDLFKLSDIFYSSSLGELNSYKKLCGKSVVKHLQQGIDPLVHKREELTNRDIEKFQCEVMFAGNLNNPIHIGRKKLIRYLKRKKVDLKLFGSNGIKEIVDEEHNKACQIAKICLGHTGLPEIALSMSVRDYKIMGAGGFLLTQHVKDIDKWFEIGRICDTYETNKECLEKIKYYLLHEDERRAIAKNAYHFVREKHTYRHRIKKILEDIQQIQKGR